MKKCLFIFALLPLLPRLALACGGGGLGHGYAYILAFIALCICIVVVSKVWASHFARALGVFQLVVISLTVLGLIGFLPQLQIISYFVNYLIPISFLLALISLLTAGFLATGDAIVCKQSTGQPLGKCLRKPVSGKIVHAFWLSLTGVSLVTTWIIIGLFQSSLCLEGGVTTIAPPPLIVYPYPDQGSGQAIIVQHYSPPSYNDNRPSCTILTDLFRNGDARVEKFLGPHQAEILQDGHACRVVLVQIGYWPVGDN